VSVGISRPQDVGQLRIIRGAMRSLCASRTCRSRRCTPEVTGPTDVFLAAEIHRSAGPVWGCLWLLPSSWDSWVQLFSEAGYAPLPPDWPEDPETVGQARANPDVLAKKTLKQVADHTTEIINALDKKPVVMGHSTGGLLAQMLAGRGLSAATVAIDPGVFRGVLPLPAPTLKVAGPFLANPLTRGRAITLTFDQFKYGWVERAGSEGGEGALRQVPCRRLRDFSHADGLREPTRGLRRR
jgi:pimeloyl-ACP methyl ester carboxylesterase